MTMTGENPLEILLTVEPKVATSRHKGINVPFPKYRPRKPDKRKPFIVTPMRLFHALNRAKFPTAEFTDALRLYRAILDEETICGRDHE